MDSADSSSAAVVLAQIGPWIEDYNTVAPHSALGYPFPKKYRAEQTPTEAQL